VPHCSRRACSRRRSVDQPTTTLGAEHDVGIATASVDAFYRLASLIVVSLDPLVRDRTLPLRKFAHARFYPLPLTAEEMFA